VATRRRILFTAKLALAAFLLWLLFEYELLDFRPLRNLLDAWWILAAAAVLAFAHWPLGAWRWYILLNFQGIPASFGATFRVAYAATFFGLYLPGLVGNDVVRIGLGLSLPRSTLPVLALSVLADRLIGLMGLLAIGVGASMAYLMYLPAGHEPAQIRTVVLLLGGMFASAFAAMVVGAFFATRLEPMARRGDWAQRGALLRLTARLISAARYCLSRPRILVLTLAASIVLHSLTLGCLAILASGLGLGDVSAWKYALAGSMTLVVNALPVTPGGIGIGEAAFSQLLLWLEPAAGALPYATTFLAYRVIAALTLLPALAFMPVVFRRAQGSDTPPG
jgi:glycosyltransferase 2 family protein